MSLIHPRPRPTTDIPSLLDLPEARPLRLLFPPADAGPRGADEAFDTLPPWIHEREGRGPAGGAA